MSKERENIGYIEREEGFYKLYYHCTGPKWDAVCFTCYEKDPELI